MTALRFAAAIIVGLLLASSAFAGPEGSASGLAGPSLLTLSPADDLFSTADLSTLVDPSGNATQHYGPYPSTSPDSGTCGNDWAEDAFDRHFTVQVNPDGTFTVTEQFKNGSFVTNMGPSPGGCQGLPLGTVNQGVNGSMHGYFIILIPPGTMQLSTSPSCNATLMTNANCDTATFIDTHFSCNYGTTCTVNTFFFHYSASDQMLIEHEWKNASTDRGGNHGDIRSMNLP